MSNAYFVVVCFYLVAQLLIKKSPRPRANCSLGTGTVVSVRQVPFPTQALVCPEAVWALAVVLAAVASHEVAQQSR